jgi:RNA polymerase sigma-70 factor (ECF subfamily)
MANDQPGSIRTRSSLLRRLKTGDDAASWQEFYRVYGRLIRDFCVQAGLTSAEVDDVVQETAIGVARNLPEFRYDPKVCRFKTWLLNQTSWRIKDQIRKRNNQAGVAGGAGATAHPRFASPAEETRTDTIQRIPDSAAPDLDRLFEVEWRKNIVATAIERVKPKFTLKQFQIFDLHAFQEWPAGDVARALRVSVANVYVTKHRIAAVLKKEVRRLERELEERAKSPSKDTSTESS